MSRILRPGWSKPPLGARLDRTHPLARGLVGLWLFNENSGARVTNLAAGVSATVTSVPTWVGTPNGGGLSFNGGQYIDVSHAATSPLAVGGGDFSLVSVVRHTSLTANQEYYRCNSSTEAGLYFVRFTGPQFDFYASLAADSYPRVASVTHPVVNQTYMVAGIRRARDAFCQIAVNGVIEASATLSLGNLELPFQTTNATIGAETYSGGGYDEYFAGVLIAQYVYNRTLSAGEVASLHAAPYQMLASSLDLTLEAFVPSGGPASGAASVRGGGIVAASGTAKPTRVSGAAVVRGGGTVSASGVGSPVRRAGSAAALGGGLVGAPGVATRVKVAGSAAAVGGGKVTAAGIAKPTIAVGAVRALGGATLAAGGTAHTVRIIGTAAAIGGGLVTASGSAKTIRVSGSASAHGGGLVSASGAASGGGHVAGSAAPLGGGVISASGSAVPTRAAGSAGPRGGGISTAAGTASPVRIAGVSAAVGGGLVAASGAPRVLHVAGVASALAGGMVAAGGVARPARVSGQAGALGGAIVGAAGTARTVAVAGSCAALGGGIASARGRQPTLILDPERTFTIATEDRAFSIETEGRTFTIATENRTIAA